MPLHAKIPEPRFILKEANSRNTLIYLMYRYESQGKSLKVSTGLKVDSKFWNKDTRRVKNSIAYPVGKKINKELNAYHKHAVAIYEESKGEISKEDFKQELAYRVGKQERPKLVSEIKIPTLFEFIEDFIYKKVNSTTANYNTNKKFTTEFGHLKAYAKARKIKINYDSIDWNFRDDYVDWLYENHELSQNSAGKAIQVLKQFLSESLKKGYHTNTLYQTRGFGVKKVKTKLKVRLTPEEVQAVIDLKLPEGTKLDIVRDLLVASCFTGLRVSDWHKQDDSHLVEYKKKMYLQLMTSKTKEEISIPIFPQLKVILKKYFYKLPVMSDQKYNESVKEVFKMACPDSTFLRIKSVAGQTSSEKKYKWEHISSHSGRRTFASNRYLEGWSLRTIKNALGHTNEAQTEKYMDISGWELAEREERIRELADIAQLLKSGKIIIK